MEQKEQRGVKNKKKCSKGKKQRRNGVERIGEREGETEKMKEKNRGEGRRKEKWSVKNRGEGRKEKEEKE